MRLVQYSARCLSGITNRAVFASLLASLALARKTLRFGRQLKWGKDMRDCYVNEKDDFNRVTTLLELGSYFVYCFVDHACFAQRIGLLPLTPLRSDYLDRFAEFFWLTECVPMMFREARAWLSGGGLEPGSTAWRARRERARLLFLKA